MNILDDTILIMDDEPHILDWLVEYLESKKYKIRQVVDVAEAMHELENNKFRVVILDLNVPAPGEYKEKLKNLDSVFQEFRGLYVAQEARSKGHRSKQVIVYSVHDSPRVAEICEKIRVNYLIKGRPRQFKKELDEILNYDPTKAGQ